MLFMLLNILHHFLLQHFFPYFPPLKPRCVLWSKKYGNSFLCGPHLKVEFSDQEQETCSIAFLCVLILVKAAGGGGNPQALPTLHDSRQKGSQHPEEAAHRHRC